jgi:hypothetical protein
MVPLVTELKSADVAYFFVWKLGLAQHTTSTQHGSTPPYTLVKSVAKSASKSWVKSLPRRLKESVKLSIALEAAGKRATKNAAKSTAKPSPKSKNVIPVVEYDAVVAE